MVNHRQNAGSWLNVLFGVAFAVVTQGAVAGPSDQPGDEQAILAAWRRREEAVCSYRFECMEEFTIAKGALGTANPGAPESVTNAVIPPSDVTLPRVCTIVLHGESGRFTSNGRNWSSSKNEAVIENFVQVCHGGERRELASGEEYPIGTVAKDASISRLLAWDAGMGPALCFRILSPDFQVFAVKAMALREVASQGDQEAITVASFSHGHGHVDVWLDPLRDYIPTRYMVVGQSGATAGSTDITYTADEIAGWVPTEWSSRHFSSKGVPTFARHVKVTAFALNEALSDADFSLDFPVGAWVNNSSDQTSYIVLPSGTHRVVQRGESAADYGRIMKSATAWSVTTVAMLTLAAVGVFLVCWAVRRRFRVARE